MNNSTRRIPLPLLLALLLAFVALVSPALALDEKMELRNRSGFFENKTPQGLLDPTAPYYFMCDGLRVYFTQEGLSYQTTVSVKHKVELNQNNNQEEYEHHHREQLEKVFQMRFLNGTNDLHFTAEGLEKGLLITSGNIVCKRYSKLILENVWENISIEYTLNDRGGFNYTILLQEGSNLSDIQMDYSSADAVRLFSQGLGVKSSLGCWTESHPQAFDQLGAPASSSYILNEGILRFSIADYSQGNRYTIDPWISFHPSYQSYDELPNPMDSVWFGLGQLTGTGINNVFNRVQLDHDAAGNIYIARTPGLFFTSSFGVNDYYPAGRFIEKYDTNGNLIFIIDHGYEDGYFSDIAVNRNNQEIYFTSLAPEINYADANGLLINTIAVDAIEPDISEVCSIDFDHCTNRLVLGFGGNFSSDPHFYGVSDATNTGVLTTSDGFDVSESLPNFLPYNDNVDISIDPETGDYFYLFLLRNSFALSDRTLLKANPSSLDATIQNSGSFLNFEELSMHSLGEVFLPNRNHFDALKCGRNAIYGTNGGELVRWNKQTGEVINTVNLSSQLTMRAEGIDIDLCGNVYIGSNNRVAVYGPNLNFITNIQLEGMPQDLAVYGNKLYAASDFALETIALPNALLPWTLSQVPDSCDACAGQASITFCAGLPENVSVEWESNGSSDFTITNVCSGWQNIIIKELKNCVLHEYKDSIFVTTNTEANCAFQIDAQDLELCENQCVTIDLEISGQEGSVTYAWSNGEVTNTPSLEFCADSTTTLEVIATDAAGAIDNASFTVTVYPFPEVFLGNDTTLCPGENLLLDAQNSGASYLWQNGSTTPTLQVSQSGIYAVEVTEGICAARDTIHVSYSLLDVNLGEDLPLCTGTGLTLSSGASSGSHLWSDGSTAFQLTTNSPGIYFVEVIDGLCSDNDTIQLFESTISALFNFTTPQGCSPLQIQFTDESISSPQTVGNWAWNFGDGNTSNLANPQHTYLTPGVYDIGLTVTNADGCTDNLVQEEVITVYTTPIAQFTLDPLVPSVNEVVEFTDLSTNALQWFWTFGNGDSSSEQDPSYIFENSGVYTVTLTVENDNCSATASTELIIDQELLVYIPNAFTPDNNHLNELFKPILFGSEISNYEFTIFNRWGEKVFKTNNPDAGWMGNTESGATSGSYFVPDGIYVWKLVVRKTNDTETKIFTGHVTLVR